MSRRFPPALLLLSRPIISDASTLIAPLAITSTPSTSGLASSHAAPFSSNFRGALLCTPSGFAASAFLHSSPAPQHAKPGGKGGKRKDKEEVIYVDPKRMKAELQERVGKTLDSFRGSLAGVRGNRASPGMLEAVRIKLPSGRSVALRDIAAVSVRGPQVLVVNPFNSEERSAIVKGLSEGKLGLNPQQAGQEIVVPLPRPSVDQLKEYVKVAQEHLTACKKVLGGLKSEALKDIRDIDDSTARMLIQRDLEKVMADGVVQAERQFAAKEKEIMGGS